jgi:two-component system, OmpR family, phosphate regulon sensor histidine kinase PhoR
LVHSRNSLLGALVATAVIVTAALTWAGWKLLELQRVADADRARQELENTAATMVAALSGKLADVGDRLSAALADPTDLPPVVDGGVTIVVSPAITSVTGYGGLPFIPHIAETATPVEVFAEAETLEHRRSDWPSAALAYEKLSHSPDDNIRAGAFLRLGRVLRKQGDLRAANRAYQRLAAFGQRRVGSAPAEFIGLNEQQAIARSIGEVDVADELRIRLLRGLDEGEWQLTRGFADFYRDELGATGRPANWDLADAVQRVWTENESRWPLRGQRVFNDGEQTVLVVFRANPPNFAMMVAFFDAFAAWPKKADLTWRLADPDGRWIAGERGSLDAETSPVLIGAGYPWTLHIARGGTQDQTGDGRMTLVTMMAAMLLFLWGATYFMARAIRREAAVARLQSDFVAAVSHEFRSPLTTIRQMTEMLELGRVVDDDRRQAYYSVLTGEASRLQRLIETLLNFGRMEAGAARYQLSDTDVVALVRTVVHELGATALDAGKRIDVIAPETRVLVRADENALGVAVRNVIDNAIKYSPQQPEVRVEVRLDGDRVSIVVIDRGMGIPRSERAAIFQKFVRGRSAIEGNVAGTGVGLPMVQQIVAAHGGEILVDSEVGRGSTFTVMLPLVNSPRADLKVGPYEEAGRGRPSGRPDADTAAANS